MSFGERRSLLVRLQRGGSELWTFCFLREKKGRRGTPALPTRFSVLQLLVTVVDFEAEHAQRGLSHAAPLRAEIADDRPASVVVAGLALVLGQGVDHAGVPALPAVAALL